MKLRLRPLALVLFLVLLVSLGPATPNAKALGGRVTNYTVHYVCIVSPMPPDPVGRWQEDCDGNWTGWGQSPGDGCTSTTVTYGARCIISP